MDEIKVSWTHAASIWWSLIWRLALFVSIAGFITGIVLGLVSTSLGITDQLDTYDQIAGVLVSIPVGIWVVKHVLSLEYRRYRIALLPSHEAMLERVVDRE